MIAAWTPQYGPSHTLRLVERPEPTVGPGELLVAVAASPVTAADIRLRTADFPGVAMPLGRLLMGVLAPRRKVQGTAFSGQVVAVGEGVTRFAVGDAVFGACDAGAWAERVVVRADGPVAHRPLGVDAATAAATPYGGGTALHVLRDLAAVQPGERVLLLGGSGGVGRFAIQVARRLGALVTAVGSARSAALMRSLGADEVLDHAAGDPLASGRRWDVVVDIAGVASFSRARPALSPRGRYVSLFMSLGLFAHMALSRLRRGPRALFSIAPSDAASMETLAAWLADGVVRPVLAERFPLDRIADAHARVEAGVHGVVVVEPPTALHR